MKPKNYTDKSAMLVGTDADPVTAGPKHFAENTPEQEKENADVYKRQVLILRVERRIMFFLRMIHIQSCVMR